MKISFLFTLLFVGLALSDWLATGFCKNNRFLQDAFVENGDCTQRIMNTYRYIQCQDNSYKMWDCDGNDCEDWARKYNPTETGTLGVCENGRMHQCFKSFNETAVINELFPRAKRVAVAYSYADWLSTFACNGTATAVTVSWLDSCIPLVTSKNLYSMAQCNSQYFIEQSYSDANCQKPVGDAWQLSLQRCEIGWYATCIDQNAV